MICKHEQTHAPIILLSLVNIHMNTRQISVTDEREEGYQAEDLLPVDVGQVLRGAHAKESAGGPCATERWVLEVDSSPRTLENNIWARGVMKLACFWERGIGLRVDGGI
jgi:hypothetical protein